MRGAKRENASPTPGSSSFRSRKVPNQRRGSLSGIEDVSVCGSHSSSESECEVIEIVSLDRSKTNNMNRSFLDSPVDGGGGDNIDNGNKSDSDESVEILDSSQCSNKSNIEKSCPVHRGFEMKESQAVNCKTKQKEVCIEVSLIDDEDEPASCKTVNTGRQQKDKRGRREKYKMLKSEVKELKSLVDVLVSLKPQSLVDGGEWTGHSNKNISFVLGSKQKAKRRKSNESYCQSPSREQSESNNRIALIEKLKAAACLEVNMPLRGTKSHQKKQKH